MLNCICEGMKKIKILLLSLLPAVGLCAQNPLLVLEAEDAVLTPPVKVKYVNGYSGDAYVGDNDSGSEILFRNVYVDKEGTYEFRTYYTSMFIRSIAVQTGFYAPVVIGMTETTEDWNRPPVGMMLSYIYLDKGDNTIKITPYNGGGPNIDKFEIWETEVKMPKPEKMKAAYAYDLTDNAVITINGKDISGSALNDNDEYTAYDLQGSSDYIYITCTDPCLITGYLFSEGEVTSQNVDSWSLEYSVDGRNYSQLTSGASTRYSAATLFTINRQPHADAGKAARYYRIDTKGRNVGEIQLFGIPYYESADHKNFPADITENVDVFSNVIGSPLGAFTIADERYFNLFDRDMERKYYSDESPVFNVEVELDKPYRLDYYTLTSCQDYPERDPKSWVVEGFDKDWEAESEVNGFVFPCRYATMKFAVNGTKLYKGYRLRTIENNGADSFQLLKWQLFGSDKPSSVTKPVAEGIDVATQNREIVITMDSDGFCKVVNLSGQIVYESEIAGRVNRIPVPPGAYLVGVIVQQERVVQKVIVK